MTMNQWFKYAKHCYSLPWDNFSRLSRLCDDSTCSPYKNWSSKIYDVISSVYCGFDVVFNENALHHPALPLYVQEHSMLKYQRAWLSSINKGYNPNKPNKLKVYASNKQGKSEGFESCDRPSPETPNWGQNWWCFVPCDLEIWWMTLENNRATLLCCFKLCATFHSWSYCPETPNLGQIRRFLELRDLEIWRMTLTIHRAPLQCYFKLCASFRSHRWFQTGDTVRKRPIWVKIDDF